MIKKTWIILLLLVGFLACRKTEDSPIKPVVPAGKDSLSLNSVQDWFSRQNVPKGTAVNSTGTFTLGRLPLRWNTATSMPLDKGNYWLLPLSGKPAYQGVQQGYRKLAFFRSGDTIAARILEIIPDGLYFQEKQKVTTADFTGRIWLYDEYYRLLGGRVFAQGQLIGLIRAQTAVSRTGTKLTVQNAPVVSTSCTWHDANYINSQGEVVVYSEKICTYSITDDPFAGGGPGTDMGGGDYAGTGGSSAPPAAAPGVSNLPGESKPAVNPKKFMDCFGNIPDAGAKMKVTVYVQEPFPGTSFNIGPNSVGHVAIGLTKAGGSQSITQVLGFYPDASGIDKLHADSKVVNNSNLAYNVSITYTVSAAQFSKITAYVAAAPARYDLMNFNCTNFVYSACKQGGITLPNPYNEVGLSGPGGAAVAMTPAGLGNSIEKLKGQSNVNTGGGTMPNSKGACN